MKYSGIANIINILFLGLFLTLPIVYALNDVTLSDDAFRLIILGGVLFTALMFADWYHIYFSNSFKSILITLAIGIFVASGCIFFAFIWSGTNIIDLIFFRWDTWKDHNLFFKFYLVGSFMFLGPILSIPRLLLIRLLTDEKLPGMNVYGD